MGGVGQTCKLSPERQIAAFKKASKRALKASKRV